MSCHAEVRRESAALMQRDGDFIRTPLGLATIAIAMVLPVLAAAPARAIPLEDAFLDAVAAGACVGPPMADAVSEPLVRIAPDARGPGYAPSGAGRPSPRALSNALSSPAMVRPDPAPMSTFAVGWAQFTASHDLARSPVVPGPEGALDIPVAADDPIASQAGGVPVMRQQRSALDPVTGESVPDVTGLFDGSTVYGSTAARDRELRARDGTGRLRVGDDGGLMMVDGRRFAGDERADENAVLQSIHELILQSIHELMMKEHNRLAREIGDGCAAGGRDCSEDEIYDAARTVNVAAQQKIFFEEFVPAFLGTGDLTSLVPDAALLDGPGLVINEFTAAAGRIGHTKVPADLEAGMPGGPRVSQSLASCIFSASCLADQSLDARIYGAITQPAEPVDTVVTDTLRNGLLGAPGGGVLIDLLATNINRGRDHGLSDYLTTRRALGFPDLPPEALLPRAVIDLYAGTDDGVDLVVGLFSEVRRPGAQFGETASAIWAIQLGRVARDPAFYTRRLGDPVLDLLDGWGMADVIAANTSLTRAQAADPFLAPAAVPLPPALAMSGLGLLGLVALRRRT